MRLGYYWLWAYKRSATKTQEGLSSNGLADPVGPESNTEAQNPTNAGAQNSAPGNAPSYSYGDPPHVNAALSVDDAYTAIPHRRTVWSDDQTTVPAGEREYLKAMFQVLDQTVVARVAGIRNYSRGNFTSFDADGELGRLSDYVRQAQVPASIGRLQQPDRRSLGRGAAILPRLEDRSGPF